MRKILIAFATLISSVAIVLALDLGRFACQYVDVGGHSLRMRIRGHGGPVVVFEGGGRGSVGAPLEMWCELQPAVSKFTTTVTYDRAGIGMSDPGPEPRDARQIARELHTALHNAGLAPPYLLVGHSFGGPLNRVFAGMYPDEIAGMVLVDPTQEEFINRDPSPAARQGNNPDNDWKEAQSSLAEAHESRVPTNVPVVLITGMGPRVFPAYLSEKKIQEYKANHQLWLKFHVEWLKKVPNGQHIITENSGHDVVIREPELIINAIQRIVVQPRNRQ